MMRARISRIFTLAFLVSASIFIGSCFIDIDFDIHDNTAQIGDICELIKEEMDASSTEEYVACDKDAETPDPETCDPRAAGRACQDNNECSSQVCVCDVCVDLPL